MARDDDGRRLTFWSFLNSQFFALIAGFALTAVVGSVLTSTFQEAAWKRDRRHEIFRQEMNEAKQVVEEVTHHIRERAYALQKVRWNPDDEEGHREYVAIKDRWNVEVYIYKNKLERLVSADLADKLLGPEMGVDRSADTVHAHFSKAHQRTKEWRECEQDCRDSDEAAGEALTALFQNTDAFIEEAYRILHEKYGRFRSVEG